MRATGAPVAVLQQRRTAHGLEVREVLDDVPPVRHVEHRRDGVVPELRRGVAREDQDQHRGQSQRREQSRQKPSRPSQIELPERDRGGAFDLLQQQAADQEPGQHEEDIDPEKSAGDGDHPGVVEQDRQHGDRPDPVETGDVTHGGRRRADIGRVPGHHRN